jgi:hypothetical protein
MTRLIERSWSDELTEEMPPPQNLAEYKMPQMQHISEILMLIAYHEKNNSSLDTYPKWFVDESEDLNRPFESERWFTLADRLSKLEPQTSALVEGSLYYGHGDFRRATESFAKYVSLRWDDFDAWNLLAASLRRAGNFEAAEAIVLSLDEIKRNRIAPISQDAIVTWPFSLHRTRKGTIAK